jgi:sarcosine oxidase delta subunit
MKTIKIGKRALQNIKKKLKNTKPDDCPHCDSEYVVEQGDGHMQRIGDAEKGDRRFVWTVKCPVCKKENHLEFEDKEETEGGEGGELNDFLKKWFE